MFVHEVGVGSVIFGVSVCGTPRFMAGMVGGGEECLTSGQTVPRGQW